MKEVTEFTASETITATVHMTACEGCEAYQRPLHIGYYPNTSEVFLDSEGTRINLPEHLLAPIIKQLKRAQVLAKLSVKEPS